MKVLFIGGTGNISSASSRLCLQHGIDLHLLHRGEHPADLPGAKSIRADISKPAEAAAALAGHQWDAVVNWIAFTPADIERDIALFAGKASQYIFISSASVYQKPPTHPVITESTPLSNPYWDYSRNKIACEDRLTRALRETGFPMVIVRPSLTYETVIPAAIGGWKCYTVIDRIKQGKPLVVHGDGTSLWTITHSEDFAKGLVGLLGNPQTIGQSFHITSDELLNWNQIYQAMGAAAGREPNLVHIPSDFIIEAAAKLGHDKRGTLWGDKSWSVIFDNSKIKRFVPGFTATIPFALGIRRTVQWMEANPARMNIDPRQNALLDGILDAWRR
jgi:nucleoside-diphosphate-sugar epimerase